MQTYTSLPIDALKDQILSAFQSTSNLIIKASPGSGKTTRIPLFLLNQTEKMIYILEPRRLAAKLAATQVARELGEKVGERVGYIFRYEKVIGSKTRILFLTEGTFLKILSQNKNLNNVGIIILDEFHERHLSTDAALAFSVKLQAENRSDLKIIIMSATIETKNLELYLSHFNSTKTLELNASRFPLKVHYLPNQTSIIQNTLAKKVRNCIQEIIESTQEGDILVFLPGMKEIRESQALLISLCTHYNFLCCLLHGDLEFSEQELALGKNPLRKIILSTNIAESSVTIPGISIVVDSGLERASSYNFYSGLPIIETTKISKASATQRAGRANRQSEGQCFRLYAQLDYEQRPYFTRPDIEKSDLSELYLITLELFSLPLNQLSWPEPPPLESLKNARELLSSLNAIDSQLNITAIGKSILEFPLHPRLGRILTEAKLHTHEVYQQVLHFLFHFLGEKNKERFFKQLKSNLSINNSTPPKSLEEIILKGFPDRIARSRGTQYFDLITMNGDTLKISKDLHLEFDPLHELWIVLDLNNKGEVTKCVSILEDWIYDLNPFPITEDVLYVWDDKNSRIYQTSRILIGKIVLSEERILPRSTNDKIHSIICAQAKKLIESLKKTSEYERLLTLNNILHKKNIESLESKIIDQFFINHVQFNEEDQKEFSTSFFHLLQELLDPDQFYNIDQDFPLSIQLSDKRKIAINYDHTKDPWLEAFIQDFYGLSQSPILAKGKLPLTLQILGPHKRAIQVTQDLASFWKTTYLQIYKEMNREYPRHYWPENPVQARPILLKRQVPI